MRKKMILVSAALLSAMFLHADFALTRDGRPVCRIITGDNPSEEVRLAASELSKYLGKLSGGTAPGISAGPVPGFYPIRFELGNDREIQPEGFRLKSDEKGLVISARQPIGLIYGAYEILKKYGGIRWLTPGEDGEYFAKHPTLSIPAVNEVCNPDFGIRSGNNLAGSSESRLWMLRNNMRIVSTKNQAAKFAGMDPLVVEGGQCYVRLLSGLYVDTEDAGIARERIEKMYREHPEYFPLINGKRMNLLDAKGNAVRQPCTTNQEVIRIVSRNLAKQIREKVPSPAEGMFWLAPSDTTAWCQCENCRKVDSESDRKNGTMISRVWIFVNEILKEARRECPEAVVYGMAYQNFQAPPEHWKTDPRMRVFLAYNRRCWRHDITDPDCPTNRIYLRYWKEWKKTGARFWSWEQVDHAGRLFLPIERNVAATLQFYRAMNCDGSYPEVIAPFAAYAKKAPVMEREEWFAMWQSMYLFAALQWNSNQTPERLLEEINALYYGKGWEGGMRDFRNLLMETWTSTPGCFGHGQAPVLLGRCLGKPGVHEKLLQYLDAAEKAAAQDSDPRALAHVRDDRKYFALTWEFQRKNYMENYHEIKAYKRTAPFVIDGILNEKDWSGADIISGFKTQDGKPAVIQTFARISFDPDNLYIAVEAMEPEPGKMQLEIGKQDGDVWMDSSVDIFLNNPGTPEKYIHLILNAKGVLFDQCVSGAGAGGDKTFESNAEVKTLIGKDRWTAEIRIPAAVLGGRIPDGMILKANLMRSRVQKDGTREVSALMPGSPHNIGTFLPVTLLAVRGVIHASGTEADARCWKDPSFSNVFTPKKENPLWVIRGGKLPEYWNLSGTDFGKKPELEMIPEKNGGYFVKLNAPSWIFQRYTGDAVRFKINFRTCGKAKARITALRQKRNGNGKWQGIGTDTIAELEVNAENWKNTVLEYTKKDPQESILFGFRVLSGEACLDDFCVNRME